MAEVQAAVAELQQAVDHRDPAAICAALSNSARRQIALAAHRRTSCRANVGLFVDALARSGGPPVRRPAATRIVTDGDRGSVVVTLPGGAARAVPVVDDSGWKVGALAGAAASASAAPPPRPSAGRPVTAWLPGGMRRPCPALVYADVSVQGGCQVQVDAARIEIGVLTVAGRFDFLSCAARLGAHIGPTGDIWIDTFLVSGGDEGCADVQRCGRNRKAPWVSPPPWRGSLRARGATLRVNVDACVTSCIGEFAGRLSFAIDPTATRWRARPDGGSIGVDMIGEWRSSPSSDSTGVRIVGRNR
jgi:hypothetical protein